MSAVHARTVQCFFYCDGEKEETRSTRISRTGISDIRLGAHYLLPVDLGLKSCASKWYGIIYYSPGSSLRPANCSRCKAVPEILPRQET